MDALEPCLWIAQGLAQRNGVVEISFVGTRAHALVHRQSRVEIIQCLLIAAEGHVKKAKANPFAKIGFRNEAEKLFSEFEQLVTQRNLNDLVLYFRLGSDTFIEFGKPKVVACIDGQTERRIPTQAQRCADVRAF